MNGKGPVMVVWHDRDGSVQMKHSTTLVLAISFSALLGAVPVLGGPIAPAHHPYPEHAKAVHEAEHAVDHAWEVYHLAALGGTVASPALQAEIEQHLHEARTLVTQAQEAAEQGDKRQVQRLVSQSKSIRPRPSRGARSRRNDSRSKEENNSLENDCSDVVLTACAVAIAPVVAAPPAASKELDPVPMVTIPAGEFLMGNPEGKGRADEWPQRSVYLDEFAIDQVEVTNERYMAFIDDDGPSKPSESLWHRPAPSVKGIEQTTRRTDDVVRRQSLLQLGEEAAPDGSGMGKGCSRHRWPSVPLGQ